MILPIALGRNSLSRRIKYKQERRKIVVAESEEGYEILRTNLQNKLS